MGRKEQKKTTNGRQIKKRKDSTPHETKKEVNYKGESEHEIT